MERIRNYKVQAEIFENLTPVQQNIGQAPITILDNVEIKNDELLKQGLIEKLEE